MGLLFNMTEKRGTGRTTRMLTAALRLASEGHRVIVIGANGDHCRHLISVFGAAFEVLGVQVETPTSRGRDSFDWESLRPRGEPKESVVLVDHYALELRANERGNRWSCAMIEEWRRYDEGSIRPLPDQTKVFTKLFDQDYAARCICHRCIRENDIKGLGGVFPLSSERMIVCPDCGNKRCPKASDHRLECTKSNDPGQPGSVYED